MKIKYIYIAMVALLMAGCSEAEIDNGQQQKGLMPVLFSAGNMEATITRAAVPYMPEDSRFVCSMFFHAGANDENTFPFYSKENPLKDNVNWFSNSFIVKGNNGSADYADGKTFYWQNRLKHVFVAITDNNLQPEAVAPQLPSSNILEYDLSKGNKTEMNKQPDPIRAYVEQSPVSATPEANRVKLSFEHQFAMIQVNIKSSQDGSTDKEGIIVQKVVLHDVASKGYVPYLIQSDGSLAGAYVDTKDETIAFEMFEGKTNPGYLKSFECIAFGTLGTISVTWEEPATNGEKVIEHTATVKSVDHVVLKSGKKYIYNIELRRTAISEVNADITPWAMDANSKNYQADGSISDN